MQRPLLLSALFWSLTCLSLAGLAACRRAAPPPPDVADFQRNGDKVVIPEGSPLRRRIQLGIATADPIRQKLSAPAVIEADPEKFARVFPPLSGHLLKLNVQLGDPVTEGEVVATLQSADFTSAQGDYVKAKSAFVLSGKALGREHLLLDAKIAAEKDVEQAQNDFDNAKSGLDAAAGRLRSFGFDPDHDPFGEPLRVFSPLDGRVVDITSAHREFHNDATAALMTVADLSNVWMTAGVREKDIRFLRRGEDIVAAVDAYPDASFTGKVLSIGDLIDPDTRTAKVRIAFANADHRLKPGMFATVNFLDVPSTQVTVPATAVIQVGASAFVLVQTAPWEFQSVQVTLGQQAGSRIVIRDGVSAGATIIVKEGALLQ